MNKVENDQPTNKIFYQTTLSNGYYIIDRIKQGKEYMLFCYLSKESNYALGLMPIFHILMQIHNKYASVIAEKNCLNVLSNVANMEFIVIF